MKKLLCVLSLALPIALISNISTADAQRKNHTDKDVPAKVEAQMPKHEGMMTKHEDKGMHKMHKKDPARWLEKEKREIQEDYDEAIEKIGKSTFSQEHKNVLVKQADANKALAMKQAKEKSDQLQKNWNECQKFKEEMKSPDKANSKAIKEVREILD